MTSEDFELERDSLFNTSVTFPRGISKAASVVSLVIVLVIFASSSSSSWKWGSLAQASNISRSGSILNTFEIHRFSFPSKATRLVLTLPIKFSILSVLGSSSTSFVLRFVNSRKATTLDLTLPDKFTMLSSAISDFAGAEIVGKLFLTNWNLVAHNLVRKWVRDWEDTGLGR